MQKLIQDQVIQKLDDVENRLITLETEFRLIKKVLIVAVTIGAGILGVNINGLF